MAGKSWTRVLLLLAVAVLLVVEIQAEDPPNPEHARGKTALRRKNKRVSPEKVKADGVVAGTTPIIAALNNVPIAGPKHHRKRKGKKAGTAAEGTVGTASSDYGGYEIEWVNVDDTDYYTCDKVCPDYLGDGWISVTGGTTEQGLCRTKYKRKLYYGTEMDYFGDAGCHFSDAKGDPKMVESGFLCACELGCSDYSYDDYSDYSAKSAAPEAKAASVNSTVKATAAGDYIGGGDYPGGDDYGYDDAEIMCEEETFWSRQKCGQSCTKGCICRIYDEEDEMFYMGYAAYSRRKMPCNTPVGSYTTYDYFQECRL